MNLDLFRHALVNSFGISGLATVLSVVIATLCAYAIARLEFGGKRFVLGVALGIILRSTAGAITVVLGLLWLPQVFGELLVLRHQLVAGERITGHAVHGDEGGRGDEPDRDDALHQFDACAVPAALLDNGPRCIDGHGDENRQAGTRSVCRESRAGISRGRRRQCSRASTPGHRDRAGHAARFERPSGILRFVFDENPFTETGREKGGRSFAEGHDLFVAAGGQNLAIAPKGRRSLADRRPEIGSALDPVAGEQGAAAMSAEILELLGSVLRAARGAHQCVRKSSGYFFCHCSTAFCASSSLSG